MLDNKVFPVVSVHCIRFSTYDLADTFLFEIWKHFSPFLKLNKQFVHCCKMNSTTEKGHLYQRTPLQWESSLPQCLSRWHTSIWGPFEWSCYSTVLPRKVIPLQNHKDYIFPCLTSVNSSIKIIVNNKHCF